MSTVTFKIYFTLPAINGTSGKQEIRRFTCDRHPSSSACSGLLSSLLGYLENTYSSFYPPPLKFLIQFDDGEDLCSISSEVEMQEAVQLQMGSAHQGGKGGGGVVKLWVRLDESAASGFASPAFHAASSSGTTSHSSPQIAPMQTEDQLQELELRSDAAAPLLDSKSLIEEEISSDEESVVEVSSEDEYVRIDEDGPPSPSRVSATSVSVSESVPSGSVPAVAVSFVPSVSVSTDTESVETSSSSTQTTGQQATPIATQTEPAHLEEDEVVAAIVPIGTAVVPVTIPTEPKVDESGSDAQQVEITDVTGHHQHLAAADEASSPPCVTTPSSRKASSSSSSSSSASHVIHYGITCDGCQQKNIVGDRYHCTVCTMPGGFDLCTACEASGTKHPVHHTLLKMRRPANISVAALHCPRRYGLHDSARQMPRPKAQFVSDVTLADGLKVKAGETLTKVWSIKNNGDEAWPVGTRLVFAGGDLMPESDGASGSPIAAIVPFAAPQHIVHISIDILVPQESGRFRSTFRLETVEGLRFGPRIWIDLVVPEADDEVTESCSSEDEEEEEEEDVENDCESEQADQANADDGASQADEIKQLNFSERCEISSASVPVEQKEAEEAALGVHSSPQRSDVPTPSSSAPGPRSSFQYASELESLNGMGFKDNDLCRYLLLNHKGDIQKTVDWLLQNSSSA